ncbi:hypothetical protein Mal35_39460 [Gimesia maris]|nr:hypothetical protein Mal35_39460 [Gimesia maris]
MQLHELVHSGDLEYFPDIFRGIVEMNFDSQIPN